MSAVIAGSAPASLLAKKGGKRGQGGKILAWLQQAKVAMEATIAREAGMAVKHGGGPTEVMIHGRLMAKVAKTVQAKRARMLLMIGGRLMTRV
eukprot:7786482-Karenia_brevis.AAC.1